MITKMRCNGFCLLLFVMLAGKQASYSNTAKTLVPMQSPALMTKNIGQWDKNIHYRSYSESWNANVHFLKAGLSFGFKRTLGDINKNPVSPSGPESLPKKSKYELFVWNLNFKNSTSSVCPSGLNEYNGSVSYINERGAFAHVPASSAVLYKNVYPGIDVNYYHSGNNLKYDFVVKPQADFHSIQMECEGIEKLEINKHGQLLIQTEWGALLEDAPFTYQLVNGEKNKVESRFKLINHNTYTFDIIGDYREDLPLVIDPILLRWSTFVGGAHPGGIAAGNGHNIYDMLLDAAGNPYCVGTYDDTFFPTTPGVYSNTYSGGQNDIVVYKMKEDGSSMLWCTYIGGSSFQDIGTSIDIDGIGNVYITGYSESANFPTTTGAYDISFGASQNAVLCKLSPSGSQLLYSTFLGGIQSIAGGTLGTKLVVQQTTGNVFLTGYTGQADFPTTAGSYNTMGGIVSNKGDAFFSILAPLGNGPADLIYSTFIGGTKNDCAKTLAINSLGYAVISGYTESLNFPTTPGCYDNSYNGDPKDDFISIISPSGSGNGDLKYSTFFGGNMSEEPGQEPSWGSRCMVLNTQDEIFLVGQTSSQNLPTTPGAFIPVPVIFSWPVETGYAIRLNPISSGVADLVYCTYLCGNGASGYENNSAMCVSLLPNNEVLVLGYTRKPIQNNFYYSACAYINSYNYWSPLFLVKLDNGGKNVLFSSLVDLGQIGLGNSVMALHPNSCGTNEIIISGGFSHGVFGSSAAPFVTTAGAFQTNMPDTVTTKMPGVVDAGVLFKLDFKIPVDFTADTVCWGKPTAFTNLTNQCGLIDSVKTWLWDFGDGFVSSLSNPTHTYLSPGLYNVKLKASCPNDSIIKTVLVTTYTIDAGPDTSICNGATITLNATAGASSYAWTPVVGLNCSSCQSATATPVGATTYSLITTNAFGCKAQDTVLISVNTNTIVANADTTICRGNTVLLSASAPAVTYQWAPPNSLSCATCMMPTATPNNSGSYTLTTVDSKGCANTDIIFVGIDTLLSPVFAGNDTSVCVGNMAVLQASGGGIFVWSNGSSGNSISVAPASSTTYTVITTNGSCRDSDEVVVFVNPLPLIDAGLDITITEGTSAELKAVAVGNTSWLNYFNNTICTGCDAVVVAPGNTTFFIAEVVDANGCRNRDSVVVTVEATESELFIPSAFSPNGDKNNDVFLPLFNNMDINNFSMYIFDRWGNEVFGTQSYEAWNGCFKNKGEPLQTGVYVYLVKAHFVQGEIIERKGHTTLIR